MPDEKETLEELTSDLEEEKLIKQLDMEVVHPLYYLIENTGVTNPMHAIRHFIQRCNIWEFPGKDFEYYIAGLEDSDGNTVKLTAKQIMVSLKEFKLKYPTILKTQDIAYSLFRRALKLEGRVIDVEVGYMSEEDERNGNDKVKIGVITMNSSNWVKPKIEYERRAHPIFDILIRSLSGGDHNIQEHIERCILQKRYFPEDYRVPTITWKDPGGTGKTIFVGKLLKTIFGGSVHIGSAEWIYKTKSNEAIMGKAVVLADDSTIKETDYDNVKRMLHNPVIEVRAQKGNPRYVKNVGWFIISGNMRTPSVPVDGGEADRRFSVIELGYDMLITMDLNYHIMKARGITDRKEADKYRIQSIPALTDPEEVAIWLGELVLRRGIPESEGELTAYHDEFYIEKIKENRDEFALTFDLAFMSMYFTRIEANDLRYFHYHIVHPSKKYQQLDPGAFGSRAVKYLKHHKMYGTRWEHKKSDGHSRFYRLTNDRERVEKINNGHILAMEQWPVDSEKWQVCLAKLYHKVDLAYAQKLPRLEYYPEKLVWTDTEIVDTLRYELGDEVVDRWTDEETECQIFTFIESVQETRKERVIEPTLQEMGEDIEAWRTYEDFYCEIEDQGTWKKVYDDEHPYKRNVDGEKLRSERRWTFEFIHNM